MGFRWAAPMILAAALAHAEVPLPPPRPAPPPPEMPLPLPRPPEAGSVQAPRDPENFGPPAPARAALPATPEEEALCSGLLRSGKIVGERPPPVIGPAGCGIAAPVTMRAVVLPNGRRVTIEPPALLRCDMAERVADWVREDVAGIAAPGGDLLGVPDAAGYVCRGRNNVPGARMSEHARGNALDILGFRYAAGLVGLKDMAARDLLLQVNRSACRRFSTMLGPGSDGYHEDNLHVDLQIRKNETHYCHWDQS